jgi:predicted membrane GTPase involved in stress response
MKGEDLRNILMIGHVDHGKTTLVDGMHEASLSLYVNQTHVQA